MSTAPEPARPTQTDPLPAGRYEIDPTRSTVAFRAKAFCLLWVRGTLPVDLASVDPADPEPTCTVTVRGRAHPVAMTRHRLEMEDGTLRAGLSTALDRTVFPMLPSVAGVSRVVHLDVDLTAVPA